MQSAFPRCLCLFFFNDTATTEIYTLSLHDALPIWLDWRMASWLTSTCSPSSASPRYRSEEHTSELQSHSFISYAVFCLKKNTCIRFLARLLNPRNHRSGPLPREPTPKRSTRPAPTRAGFFFLLIRRPPISTLFPPATLFQ